MFGSILSGVGAIAGAIGAAKGKKGEAPAQQGFAALPEKVQKAWMDTYLPEVLKLYQQPRATIPMERAPNPEGNPFASKALYDFQQYSDRMRNQTGQGFFPQPQYQQPPMPSPMTMAEEKPQTPYDMYASRAPVLWKNRPQDFFQTQYGFNPYEGLQ